MVVKRPGENRDESSEQSKAALPCLDAPVSQLLVEGADYGVHLGVQEGHRTKAEKMFLKSLTALSFPSLPLTCQTFPWPRHHLCQPQAVGIGCVPGSWSGGLGKP